MDVKIVELEPMRFAAFHVMGTSPEEAVWAELIEWAKPLGFYQDPKRRLFGFNNPNPTPGNPVYGYEAWIQVDNDFEDPKATIKDFPGGKFLVTRVEVPKGNFDVIGEGWRDLVEYKKKNGYEFESCQCLEESIRTDRQDLEFILDLFLPIM